MCNLFLNLTECIMYIPNIMVNDFLFFYKHYYHEVQNTKVFTNFNKNLPLFYYFNVRIK